jgi:hypothetical protein
MTLPSYLLGFLLSSLYGAAFHVRKGGSLGRLLLYMILGWAGFWGGHFLASWAGWDFASLGPLHLGAASFLSLLFLVVGHWISQVDAGRR